MLAALMWHFTMVVAVLGLEAKWDGGWSWVGVLLAMLADTVFHCRQTYLDGDGDEVCEGRRMAARRVRTCLFWEDVAACVPWELAGGGGNLGVMLSVVRLSKLRRVMRLLKKANFSGKAASIAKLAVLLVFLVMVTLLMAAFLLQTVYIDCVWYPVVEQTNPQAPEHFDFCRDRSPVERFFFSVVYTNILVISEGEALPQSEWQLCYDSLLLLGGSFLDALIFGIVVSYVHLINEHSNFINGRFDSMRTTMKDLRLSHQRSFLDIIRATTFTQLQHDELQRFFRLLSPSLRSTVAAHISRSALPPSFLASLPPHSESFLHPPLDLLLQHAHPEDTIFSYRQVPDALYFIVRGNVLLSRPRLSHLGYAHHALLGPCDSFGEVGALFGTPRSLRATTSHKYTLLTFLPRDNLLAHVAAHPPLKAHLLATIHAITHTRPDPFIKALTRHLKRARLLRPLEIPAATIAPILFRFTLRSFEKGEYLWRKGDKSQGLLVLLSGYASFLVRVEGLSVPVHAALPGDVLGIDHAINSHDPHLTSLRAESLVRVALLPTSDFDCKLPPHSQSSRSRDTPSGRQASLPSRPRS